MWEGIDSQEVGLEAAILQRKRNSSLVELACAEDLTGLSCVPKLREEKGTDLLLSPKGVDFVVREQVCPLLLGRGAFRKSAKVRREACWRHRK